MFNCPWPVFVRFTHLCSRNGRPARVSFRCIHIHRPWFWVWVKHDGLAICMEAELLRLNKANPYHTVHAFFLNTAPLLYMSRKGPSSKWMLKSSVHFILFYFSRIAESGVSRSYQQTQRALSKSSKTTGYRCHPIVASLFFSVLCLRLDSAAINKLSKSLRLISSIQKYLLSRAHLQSQHQQLWIC